MEKIFIEVPYINQAEKWPTGCESVSTVMMLQYLGLDISVDEFIEKLPLIDFQTIDGELCGGDPNDYFLGSPYDSESYGCYAKVIKETMNRIFAEYGKDYQAIDITGQEPEKIEAYLKQGMPVIYWATIDLNPSFKQDKWKIIRREGSSIVKENAVFEWAHNEHCMLLVGCDDKTYYFNDPWNNNGVIGYDRELVLNRHTQMRELAVAVVK